MMKRIGTLLIALVCTVGTQAVLAAGADGFKPEPANNDVTNLASLQRGARYYMNYCLGCHALEHVRYNRIAQDLRIPEDEFLANLAFTTDEIGDMVKIAMPKSDAEGWFGLMPPDLSLVTRSRSPDWVYNFLRTFYVDEGAVTGSNNMMKDNPAMPNVLWSLQGLQKPVYETNDRGEEVFAGFEIVREGRMTPAEFDRVARDITNFLDYIGEPVQAKRRQLGFWVLAFIGVFIFLAWLMKKEYWRDVH
jgi:ubiquinol-cytochrome c reductase cytochrome c1 subunit